MLPLSALRTSSSVATLGLLAACGPVTVTPTTYSPKYPLPVLSPAVPAGTPLYEIYYADLDVAPVTYGITTGGFTWLVAFQSDALPHQLAGDIYCPVSCVLDNVVVGEQRVAAPASPERNHYHFELPSAANTQQRVRFDVSTQPVTFFLTIDGQPATLPKTVFPWRGLYGSPAQMPFSLLSGPF